MYLEPSKWVVKVLDSSGYSSDIRRALKDQAKVAWLGRILFLGEKNGDLSEEDFSRLGYGVKSGMGGTITLTSPSPLELKLLRMLSFRKTGHKDKVAVEYFFERVADPGIVTEELLEEKYRYMVPEGVELSVPALSRLVSWNNAVFAYASLVVDYLQKNGLDSYRGDDTDGDGLAKRMEGIHDTPEVLWSSRR